MSNLYISNLCSDNINSRKFLNLVSKVKNIKGLDVALLNGEYIFVEYQNKSIKNFII